jgi:hypothetical protein
MVPSAPITIVNVPEAEQQAGKVSSADLAIARRERIADSVSRSIMSGEFQGRATALEGRTGVSAEPTSESVTITQMLRQSDELLREAELVLGRGAFFSAREAALGGLHAIAAANDAQRGGTDHSEALRAAIDAVREASDFVGRYGHADSKAIARMAFSHQTPVLKGVRTDGWTPHAAANRYLDFARENFTAAAGGNVTGTALLRVLANAEKATRRDDVELANSIVLCYLRSAVATNVQDSQSLNELGFYTMHVGLLQESQWALERSLALQPSTPALQNLIEVHRLAGNIDRARELVALLPQETGNGGQTLTVTPIDSQVFAAISPPVQLPSAPQANVLTTNTPEEPQLPPEAPESQGGGVMKRLTGSVKSVWK